LKYKNKNKKKKEKEKEKEKEKGINGVKVLEVTGFLCVSFFILRGWPFIKQKLLVRVQTHHPCMLVT
jgi:hypothetical protein